jgi:hypothetical protein
MTTRQRSAARSPNALADAWERRTLLVKQECAAASAASDAKTARLRALRLEKERQDAQARQQPDAGAVRAPRRAGRVLAE